MRISIDAAVDHCCYENSVILLHAKARHMMVYIVHSHFLFILKWGEEICIACAYQVSRTIITGGGFWWESGGGSLFYDKVFIQTLKKFKNYYCIQNNYLLSVQFGSVNISCKTLVKHLQCLLCAVYFGMDKDKSRLEYMVEPYLGIPENKLYSNRIPETPLLSPCYAVGPLLFCGETQRWKGRPLL